MTASGTDQPRNDDPVEPKSDNPSLNSRLHAATEIQSSVTPQDYPARDRQLQVEQSTAGKEASGKEGSGKAGADGSGASQKQAPAEGADDVPPPAEGSPEG
jgi:hypothetical protein